MEKENLQRKLSFGELRAIREKRGWRLLMGSGNTYPGDWQVALDRGFLEIRYYKDGAGEKGLERIFPLPHGARDRQIQAGWPVGKNALEVYIPLGSTNSRSNRRQWRQAG